MVHSLRLHEPALKNRISPVTYPEDTGFYDKTDLIHQSMSTKIFGVIYIHRTTEKENYLMLGWVTFCRVLLFLRFFEPEIAWADGPAAGMMFAP